ncbi:MAG TPA: hypothetical protein VHW05_08585 [Phenylobacterium sp.]|jgi:hypothetical protein|nr:hypothetical protein [Phenylobacterium sp.]
MIALVLAAQLMGVTPANPHQQVFSSPPPAGSAEVLRALPRKAVCKNDLGRMEVSLVHPAALYRHGDRPAKGLKTWADYPDAAICDVGDVK